MKRKISFIGIVSLLALFLLLFLGKETFLAKKTYELETEIKETTTTVQSITKVKTKDKKLNQEIDNHLQKEQKEFEDYTKNTTSLYLLEKEELNIDTILFETDSFLSISMVTYMNGPSFAVPTNKIETILWNRKKKKRSELGDFLKDDEILPKLQEELYLLFQKSCPNCLNKNTLKKNIEKNSTNFYLTEEGFVFTVNPSLLQEDYHDILTVPLAKENPYLNYPKEQKEEQKEEKKTVKKAKTIDPSLPSIALTFDDGPSQYTEEIIKILEENEVNATFFILGNKVATYKNTLKQSIENGNELGNHSYNHQWLSRLSTTELEKQINKTQEIIQEELDYTPTLLRPTYGSVNRRIKKNCDLTITLWTVDTKDWKIKNTSRIVERATTNISDLDIILMHDIFERSKNALKEIIPNLKEQGFQLVTVSELEEIKKIREYEKR